MNRGDRTRFDGLVRDPFLGGLTQEVLGSLEGRLGDHDPASDGLVDSGLLHWGRNYLPQHFALDSSAMHVWLAEQLEKLRTKRGIKLNVIGPRGGAKSTVVTLAYVLAVAVEGSEPYIWIVSDTKHQACSHLDNVRAELVDNALLAKRYSEAVGRGAVWRANLAMTLNGVTIEALGTGQRIRGRRRREHRPTLIVCDDLQNDQHMQSALQRETTRRWFHGTLLKAGTKSTNVINLATALHRDALALELHRTPGWISRVFAAIVQWPSDMLLWEQWESIFADVENPRAGDDARAFYEAHQAEMDAGAVVLWPAQEDLYALMRMRVESGRTAFEREKQGSPVNPEACEWPESYFGPEMWFEEWPGHLRIKTLALDPSKGTDSRRGDYSAFVALGIDEQGVIYVEADLARRPTPQIVRDGVELYCKFRPDAFGIEANQFQELLGGEFLAEFRRQGELGMQPWTLDNRVPKHVRIRRLGPLLSARRIRFKANSPSTRLLVDQLQSFPIGDHDDGPDACEMALRLASEIGAFPLGVESAETLRVL